MHDRMRENANQLADEIIQASPRQLRRLRRRMKRHRNKIEKDIQRDADKAMGFPVVPSLLTIVGCVMAVLAVIAYALWAHGHL